MADAPNGKNKKDLSMEQRLLLAFSLMLVVLVASQYLLPKPPIRPADKQEQKQGAPKAEIPPAVKPSTPAEGTPEPTGETVATKAEDITLDTDLYTIKFSNRGAVVTSWILKNYKQDLGNPASKRPPLELVNLENVKLTGIAPFSLYFKDQKPAADLSKVLYVVKRGDDGLSLTFEYASGKTISRKSFKFQKASYLSDISSEVLENGVNLTHQLMWRGGFGDSTVQKAYASEHTVYLAAADKSPTLKDANEGKNGPVSESGTFVFAGLQDTYFAAVFLPPAGTVVELTTFSDNLPEKPGSTDKVNWVGAAVGSPGKNLFKLFVGPKEMDILRTADPRLESIVDWGWFKLVAQPLFSALKWLYNSYLHNWGWSILVLTLAINLALLPLKLTSMKSMKKMSAIQPQIAAINEKYKGIPMTDPRKNEQNAEIMELYKKNGVNPAGGCVPMLLQLPFFFAFYKVLSLAIELRGANWLWVTDLSQPETIPIRVLPLIMIASQFYLQKMTPTTGGDPAQQKIMLLMPLFMGFLFYNASSGLVLYWLTGNLVGIAQQLFFNRLTPTPVVETKVVPKKKSGR
jgi:YidC/Oxa1 family membrane protein insertase